MTGPREQSEPSTHTGSPTTTSKPTTTNPQLPLIALKSPGAAPRPWSAASDSGLKPAVVATTKRAAATATVAKKPTATNTLEKILTLARNGTRSEAALIGHDTEPVVAKVSGWRRNVKNGKSAGSMPRIVALVDPVGEMGDGDGGRVSGSGSKNSLFRNDQISLDSVVKVIGHDLDTGVAVMPGEKEAIATLSEKEVDNVNLKTSSDDLVALDFVEETEASQRDSDFVLSNSPNGGGSRRSQGKLEATSIRNSTESIGDSKTVEDGEAVVESDWEPKRVSFSDSIQDERLKLGDPRNGRDDSLNTTEIEQEEQESMNRIHIPDPAGAPSKASAEVPRPRFLVSHNTSFALPPVFQAAIQNAILADAAVAMGKSGPFGHKIKHQRSLPPPPGTSHKRRLEMLGIVIPAARSTSQVKPVPSKPTHRFAASEKSKPSSVHAIPATLSKRPNAGVQSWGARFPHPYLHFKNDDTVPSVDGNGLYLFDNDAGSAVNPHAVRTPGFRVLQADGRVGFEIAPMAALGWLKRIGGVSQQRLTNFGSGPRGKGGHAIGRQASQTK
ncbi:hypothetical protein HDU81_005830 [Chytriomyces hyalinus]|nr:hypothetical protein HDU81_005830 [Chytriomyces hyalinus]